MVELEEIEDEIKSLSSKRDRMILDVNKLQDKIIQLTEQYQEKSGKYTKVECLTCGGVGYIQDEKEGKKSICKNPTLPFLSCNGKGYIWLKKYEIEKD